MILLFRQNKGSQSKKKFHVFNPFKVPVRLGAKVSESNEPVVGLSFLTETLAVSDPEMEPHYTCGLCNQQGQANVMLLHLRVRQHRLNWLLTKQCVGRLAMLWTRLG